MLATAGDLPPDDDAWAYEMKWDGVRAIALVEPGAVRLWSRSGREITASYPELRQPPDGSAGITRAVLDGEIVAFGGGQWPSFEALQQRINISSPAQIALLAAEIPVSYLAFDLLCLDEQAAGRRAVRRAPGPAGRAGPGRHWQVPPSFTDVTGADLLAVSRQQGLEGVVAKRLTSRYEPGKRSPAWRKVKVVLRQEAVVGGWRPGEGVRAGQIGSLLVGVYGPAGLDYAGHVGTGFTQQALGMLGRQLFPLRRGTSPFAAPVPPDHARGAVWAEPRLVVEVGFGGWTSAGVMRAASYKGLRTDKDPAEVVRES